MRLVCEECRKVYNYDTDDFCPKCGAYNQPRKSWDVDAMGNVVRVDGVNESNHKGSFVHREIHGEKFRRRISGMDREGAVKRKTKQTVSRPSVGSTRKKEGGSVFTTIIGAVILLQVLRSCAGMFY